ncbi:MAG: hypothetical protein WC413_00660 [Candidatus Nanoarchaeia archaeon]
MKNVDELKKFSVYPVIITYYTTGIDTAIAAFHKEAYNVFEKTEELAIKKATTKFKKEFPDKTIDRIGIGISTRLEDCLF